MDAMALLCTLHADGPTTLRRLRASGIRNLGELESAEADSISRLLEIPAAAARRFLREAVALSARVEEEPLEAEAAAPASLPQTVEEPEASALSTRDQRLVDQVLTRWREADEGGETPEPRPAPKARATGLRPEQLDGLTRELCEKLAAAGIESIAELAQADSLLLRDVTGIGYSTLRRFQFLARRAEAEPAVEERISVRERPPIEGAVRAWELAPEELGDLPEASEAGGPFA